jgi:glucokinase
VPAPTGECLLALDFGGTKIALAVADTTGRIEKRVDLPTRAGEGAERVLQRGLGAAKQLLAEQGGALHSVGVSSMGITLEERVVLAPNVPGWDRLALPDALRRAFGAVPIRIENDVKAASFAELKWGALRGVDSGIYVNLGTGIAAALVVDGRIVRGAHGASGEIGFNPLSPSTREGVARGRAPLEESFGGRALEDRIRDTLGMGIEDAFARYRTQGRVRRVLDEYFDTISFHLANLAIALDPSRIVLGAGLMRSAEIVLPALRDRILCFTPFPVEVQPARFLTDAALVGAVALALEPLPEI